MARRYSADILSCSALWKNTSPALYRQILQNEVLTLPSKSLLEKLTSAFSVDSGMSDATERYLKMRFSKLNDREKVVNLIVDEVYSSKRVEYSGGKIYGYENQAVTKTVLCFMIASVGGRYHDVVCMCPIDKLDADILHEMWKNVLATLTAIGS